MNDVSGIPQYPWDEGDTVYASALNAAIANSVALGGGMLPLTGGTMTGPFSVAPPANAPNQFTVNTINPISINTNGWQTNSYMVVQALAGGSFSDMYCNIRVDTTLQGAGSTGVTGVLSQMTSNAVGGSAGYVPFYGQMSRKTINAGGAAQNPQIWGAVFEVIDWTNTDSASTNFMSGIEIDITCGNTDSATSRRALGIYLNYTHPTDVPPVCHMGVHIAANSGSYNYPLRIQTPYNIAAIDLTTSVKNSGAHTVWMATGGDVAWDTAGTKLTYWDTAASAGAGGLHHIGNLQVDGLVTVFSSLASSGFNNLLLLEENGLTAGGAAVMRIGRDFSNPYNSGYMYYQMNATANQSTLRLGMFGAGNDHLVMRGDGAVLAPFLPGSTTYANDAAAAAGGIIIGQFYRNGSVVQVRVI